VAHTAIVAGSHEDAWARIHRRILTPASTVVLEGGSPLDEQPGSPSEVKVVRYQANDLEFEVNAGTDGYLFLSDPFYPGWRATVDGQPAHPAGQLCLPCRGCAAGKHLVSMTFRSGSWYLGLGASLFTLLIVVSRWWRGPGAETFRPWIANRLARCEPLSALTEQRSW